MSTLTGRTSSDGATPQARRGQSARPVWMEAPSRGGSAAKAAALVVIAALVLFPFVIVISSSLASQAELTRNGGFVFIPLHPTLDAYRAVFSGGIVTRAVLVSVAVTAVGTVISMVVTAMTAYALSRPGSLLHRPILMTVLLTFLFSPGIIPTYLMVKELGLLNSYWALIVPTAINAFNIIIVRSFFMSLPQEILDSARIDGAGEWQTLLRVVLPLSKAVIAVVSLFYAVGYWNSFFNALLYLDDSSKWPLQLVLRAYVLQGSPLAGADTGSVAPPPQQAIQMAVVVIAIVPILCVYPFLQRHFAKGVLTGAVKG